MADDPLAQFFEGESDPISKFFGAGAAPSVAPPPSLEELRAQRVRTASPKELRNIHFGENIPAGQQQDQRSVLGEFAQGALAKGPASAVASIGQVPSLLYQSIKQPAQVGLQVAKVPGELYGKLSSGTPEEAGQAAFDVGATLLPMKGAIAKGLEGGAAELAAARSARHTSKAADHMLASLGVSPSDTRAVAAIDQSLPILRSMSKAKRPFRDLQSFADFTEGSAKKYFEAHHENIAKPLKDTQVAIGDEQMNLTQAMAERARLNKRLHRYNTQDPKTQAIMEEVNPKLKEDVSRLHDVRNAINTAIDTAAPQSLEQADIMRNYSHLQELSEMAKARAFENATVKRIAAGSKEPMGTVAKDAAIRLATFGTLGRSPQLTARAMGLLRRTWQGAKIDPDIVMKRASKRFQYIKPAEPVTPISIPESVSVPVSSQQPAPISGGTTIQPVPTPSLGMTEEEFVNAMSQPDVNVVPRPEMERRVLDRIASGYAGPERRAVEVPEEFKGKITDYNRRKKSAALYRKQYEKPPR